MLHSPDGARPRRDGQRVLLVTAGRDWHARTLHAALTRRGVAVTTLALESCVFDTGAPFGLRCGPLAGLPDGVLVRTVAAGSFEAITRRLGILHALRSLGVPVCNDALSVERCVDKSMTTFLLARAGLPVPETWALEGAEAARAITEAECPRGPLVLKPLFGSQGRGLVLVNGPDDLPAAETVADVFYLQRFIGGEGPAYRDYRIFVIDGEPVAGMAREGAHWITNVKQGGRPVAVSLDRELASLACAAAAAVGAFFCGVDVLRGPDGTPYVLEVNSMPAWSGLQSVASIDIADVLAERFCRRLPAPAHLFAEVS